MTWTRLEEAGRCSSADLTAAWTSRGAGGNTKWSVCVFRAVNHSKSWKNFSLTSSLPPHLLQGFGDVLGEHWLGNEALYLMTSQGQYSLRVQLNDWEGNSAYSLYDRITLANERQQYRYTPTHTQQWWRVTKYIYSSTAQCWT